MFTRARVPWFFGLRLAMGPGIGLVVGLVVGLVACHGKHDQQQVVQIDPAITTCTDDNDCKLVEMQCCDSCNGGDVWAVNAAHADEAKARYGKACGKDQRCGDRLCTPEPTAVCRLGSCATQTGDGIELDNVRE